MSVLDNLTMEEIQELSSFDYSLCYDKKKRKRIIHLMRMILDERFVNAGTEPLHVLRKWNTHGLQLMEQARDKRMREDIKDLKNAKYAKRTSRA